MVVGCGMNGRPGNAPPTWQPERPSRKGDELRQRPDTSPGHFEREAEEKPKIQWTISRSHASSTAVL